MAARKVKKVILPPLPGIAEAKLALSDFDLPLAKVEIITGPMVDLAAVISMIVGFIMVGIFIGKSM